MTTHYTAVLSITRTEDTIAEPDRRGYSPHPPKPERTRDSHEELKLTIRGRTLSELTENLAAHTALLKKGNA